MQNAYYLKKLKEDFSKRSRANQAFSLRAYARYLEVHPSTLSQVLLGKRPLPLKAAARVQDRLRLSARERTLFRKSLEPQKSLLDEIRVNELDQRFVLDETYFQIIAEWEHYALLTLLDCEKFSQEPSDIAERLNITKARAEVVVANLLRYGLLTRAAGGQLVKAHPRVSTSEDIASPALRASHLETLELGQRKLQEVAIELRDFSSLMVGIDVETMPEAKTLIREFRQKMLALFAKGKKQEVYQLAIQFYPLTQQGNQKK